MRRDPGGHALPVKERILNTLLDRYERSRAFQEPGAGERSPGRRIAFRPETEKAFALLLEDSDERKGFLSAVRSLQEEGLIGYEWVRFEKGNLIERIWLVTEEKALAESYALTGRIAKADQLKNLRAQIQRTKEEIQRARGGEEETDLERFLLEMERQLEEKRSIPRFFFRGEKDGDSVLWAERRNENLLRFLSVMAVNREEMLERVVSTRLFGDSKYFERELKSHVLSILRSLAAGAEEGDPGPGGEADACLLEERGIMKWPEILEFCGPVRVLMDTGSRLDFSGQIYGACINSDTVRHASGADLTGVSQILTIENKANYTWYIANERREGELVLYHGGAFSPIKGRWMKLLAGAAGDVPCRHWSDIDLGGFRIFVRLKKEVFPSLQPERMDLSTLLRFRDSCIEIGSEQYLERLKGLLDQPDYEPFYALIGSMVRERLRLEQEAEI